VGALLGGMLKRPTVHASGISRALEEKIAPKKTDERLHRNLRREGLGRGFGGERSEAWRVDTADLVAAAHRFPRNRLSDIPKYAMYMIVAAVAFALETTVRRSPPPLRIRKRNHFQLALPFPAF